MACLLGLLAGAGACGNAEPEQHPAGSGGSDGVGASGSGADNGGGASAGDSGAAGGEGGSAAGGSGGVAGSDGGESGSGGSGQAGAGASGGSGGNAAGSGSGGSSGSGFADVLEVSVSGDPENYTFNVTIRSPDTGCEKYADWWEVIDATAPSIPENLVYRRILEHSHVEEQPFTRSGGPVAISAEVEVTVRAHMHSAGYGGQALRGSVARGFEPLPEPPDFAGDLETFPPVPDGCAY